MDNSSADKFRTGFRRFALGLSGLVVADRPMRVFSWFNIREGNAIDQFKLPGKQVIIFPPELRSGDVKYPFSDIMR